MVNPTATLGGTGTVGTLTTAGGTVNPGDPVTSSAKLTVAGNTTLGSGGFTLEIPNYANPGSSLGYDQVNLGTTNSLTLGGGSTLTLDLTGLDDYLGWPPTSSTYLREH